LARRKKRRTSVVSLRKREESYAGAAKELRADKTWVEMSYEKNEHEAKEHRSRAGGLVKKEEGEVG